MNHGYGPAQRLEWTVASLIVTRDLSQSTHTGIAVSDTYKASPR